MIFPSKLLLKAAYPGHKSCAPKWGTLRSEKMAILMCYIMLWHCDGKNQEHVNLLEAELEKEREAFNAGS